MKIRVVRSLFPVLAALAQDETKGPFWGQDLTAGQGVSLAYLVSLDRDAGEQAENYRVLRRRSLNLSTCFHAVHPA